MKCDCGEQLHTSIERIYKYGCGVLVYLSDHEGRGIGLAKKLEAYNLQSNAVASTPTAPNRALGFGDDQRVTTLVPLQSYAKAWLFVDWS